MNTGILVSVIFTTVSKIEKYNNVGGDVGHQEF